MDITIKQFQELIDAAGGSWYDYLIQILGIVVPLVFAWIVAKSESKKATLEEGEKNQVLDVRQRKLEDIQHSISNSINELTEKHNELVSTQKSVEQNLLELKRLSEQTRQANLLTLQSVYKDFFDKYKEFEAAVNKLERLRPKFVKGGDWSIEEKNKLLKVYEEIECPKICSLKPESIPMIVFEEYNQLNKILWENALKKPEKVWDIFDSKYDELLTVFKEFRKKLYYDI